MMNWTAIFWNELKRISVQKKDDDRYMPRNHFHNFLFGIFFQIYIFVWQRVLCLCEGMVDSERSVARLVQKVF